jgi:mRNA-degrading endonuclease RelE of RelBE toxin-antitoxin system
MSEYEIRFKASAAKEFRKLALEIQQRFRSAVNELKFIRGLQ